MRGDNCPYIHNKKICPNFLMVYNIIIKGTCFDVNCKYCHNTNPNNIPHCVYYLEGNCTYENCPYYHVKLREDAPICELFLRGKCDKGAKCDNLHCYPSNHINSKIELPPLPWKVLSNSMIENNKIIKQKILPNFLKVKL